MLGVSLDSQTGLDSSYPSEIPDPVRAPAFANAIGAFLSTNQISDDPETRLRHGHGHTQEEMYAIKHGRLDRIPDLVVFPVDDDRGSTTR